MMKELIIIGASGLGREVAWIVERINAHWVLSNFKPDVIHFNEGIVSRELWNTVQERIAAAERDREAGLCRNTTQTHYLYGLVFCAECGAPMIRRSYTNRNKTKYKAWNCRGRQKQKNGCQNPAIREEDLIAEIVAALQAHGVEIDGEDEETITANVRRVDVSAEEIRIIFKDEEESVAV